ncbi:FadR/GntR family transcriptional regulator [Nakamurella lactea]|uniref:FadR/GntR family transcriptional regulator n=1 Tax=Nakamurella lactea TaxID=459515 RepID=UPI000414FB24|nr:FadR/GntR family transcriptional regulator [Nakamurella lactea]
MVQRERPAVPSSSFGDPAPRSQAGAARARGRAGRAPRKSRSDQVQEQIKELILDDKLRAGDPMPTELELVEQLDISRNSLREALKALEAVGIIEIRHGFGMYVGQISLGALADELTFHHRIRLAGGFDELGSLIQIRELLECGLLEVLITGHPDADLSEVAAVIETMSTDAESGPVRPQTDRRFHELLYTALDNPLVAPLLGAFWDVYHRVQDDLPFAVDEKPADTVRRHRDIYQAVLDADLPAATAAMRRHFDGVRERIAARAAAGTG